MAAIGVRRFVLAMAIPLIMARQTPKRIVRRPPSERLMLRPRIEPAIWTQAYRRTLFNPGSKGET